MSHPLAHKRILLVLTTLDLGGAERQALHLASYLQDHCHAEVAVVALYGGTGTQMVRHLCVERRLPCLRVSMPDHTAGTPSFRSIRQFARELEFLSPDIILPYTALPNVLCNLTWKRTGAAVCLWNQRDAGLELPREHWTRAALTNAGGYVSNSRDGVAFLQSLDVPAEKIQLIYNGVLLAPPQDSRAAFRQRLAIAAQTPVAVMVANIHPAKDHATIIRAWQHVCRQLSTPPVLLLAGQEVEAASAKALVTDLNLQSHVRFLGHVKDITGLLFASDLAVFSAIREGTPNAVLEAMAAGLPVVATDLAGCRDALGQTYPHLVATRDPSAFAHHIVTLLKDPDLRTRLGNALRNRAANDFSVATMCEKTTALLTRHLV